MFGLARQAARCSRMTLRKTLVSRARRTSLSGTALGVSLEGRKRVEAWLERCRTRPARARVR